MINGCIKCQEHDDRTKELFSELMSISEVGTIATLLVSSIGSRHGKIMSPGTKDAQKMMLKRDIDFMSAMLGKFMLRLDAKTAEPIHALAKKLNMTLKIHHEACPHVRGIATVQ